MATAKKLPSGSYRVRIFDGVGADGKKKYKSFTADTKKEAEFMAAEYSLKRRERPQELTVGEAIDKYIAAKENVLSPTSIQGYKKIRRTRFQPLMSVKLSKLTAEKVQSAVNADVKQVSAKTVCDAHGLLSSALRMFYPDFMLRTTLPKKPKKLKRDLPTPRQIYEAVQGSEIETPVLMAMWLGLRMSELRGIQTANDIVGNLLYIRHVVVTVEGKRVEKELTKTESSTRIYKLPDELLSKVDFSKPHITELTGSALYKRFSRRIEKAGLPHMTFHDLRHLNASVMHALNIPDKYAMERGGWETDHIMKTVYQETLSEERRKVDEVIDGYFKEVIKNI